MNKLTVFLPVFLFLYGCGAATQNSAPVANAGADQTVRISQQVTLDGNASSDTDSNALTYHWAITKKPDGSTALLANENTVSPGFSVDVVGEYQIELVVNDGTVDSKADRVSVFCVDTPVDTYFSLAVTDNSLNHVGARLLFLDFQHEADNSVISNNHIIAPKAQQPISIDGDSSDWNKDQLSTINGLVQNNYPLSFAIDGTPVAISVGARWDDEYIYFLLEWEDAGHTQSTQYRKWIYANDKWQAKSNVGITVGAPNETSANANHPLGAPEDEDRAMLMFPISDSENNFSEGELGCAAYCHANLKQDDATQNYTGSGVSTMYTNVDSDNADVWQWLASRSNPLSLADDISISHSSGYASGYIADSGVAPFVNNSLAPTNPKYMHNSGLSYKGDVLSNMDAVDYAVIATNGDEIPSVLLQASTGDRADVRAKGKYSPSTGKWTLELQRKLSTGHQHDRDFWKGAVATPPTKSSIDVGNVEAGKIAYNICNSCHLNNGVGSRTSNSWLVPRIQRVSGSLIRNALRNINAMSWVEGTFGNQDIDEVTENIAAYLQTQATFGASKKLTVNTLGVNAPAVYSSPAGIDCQSTCSADFFYGASVTLTARNISGYTFNGWSGDCSGANITCTISMSEDRSVNANYSASTITYVLSLTVGENGSISINPSGNGGGSCNSGANCTNSYATGTSVTLTPIPNSGYQFAGFGGSCAGVSPCTVNMDSTKSVTASFFQISMQSLNITLEGNGSVVVRSLDDNTEQTCASITCNYSFPSTANIGVTANADAGYLFEHWSGECSGSGVCNLSMTVDRTITAKFVAAPTTPNTCDAPATPTTIPNIMGTSIASGLFSPTHVTNSGDGSSRLFIVEKRGTIRVFQNGSLQTENYLDIRDRVDADYHTEAGLLSVAFHPNFSNNGKFYVDYTSGSSETVNRCPQGIRFCSVISEFTVVQEQLVESSERVLLTINQPSGNHNGGQLAFGPDGYLYIGMGDGGGANDVNNNAQNLTSLLGKMLRIDVDAKQNNLEYAIPPSNPDWSSVSGAKPEIYALGLRNPWRFSFDPKTGLLYLGDVGQSDREEIDIIKSGMNYGWRIMEGNICNPQYDNQDGTCSIPPNYYPPIIDYLRNGQWGSVAGGVVYRGSTYPDICGVYFYTDTYTGNFFALRYLNGTVTDTKDYGNPSTLPNTVSSFGYGEDYEVYFVDYANGNLYHLELATP